MSIGGKHDCAAVRRADNGRCCVGHIGNRPFLNGAAVKAIGRIPRRGKRPVFIRDTVAVIDCSVFADPRRDLIALIRFQSGDRQRFSFLPQE